MLGGLPGAAELDDCTKVSLNRINASGSVQGEQSSRIEEIIVSISKPGDKDTVKQQAPPPVRERRSGSGSCRVGYSIVDHTLGKLR